MAHRVIDSVRLKIIHLKVGEFLHDPIVLLRPSRIYYSLRFVIASCSNNIILGMCGVSAASRAGRTTNNLRGLPFAADFNGIFV